MMLGQRTFPPPKGGNPEFNDRLHDMPVCSGVFGVTINEQARPSSNDIAHGLPHRLRREGHLIHVVVQDYWADMPEIALPHDCHSYLQFGLHHVREQILGLDGTFQGANGGEGGRALKFSSPMPQSE